MKRKLIGTLVAAGMIATPIAAKESLDRASAPIERENGLSGESNLFFLAGIAAVAASIVLLSEDDDEPVSA
ncbi:hypothetical protein [Qipengyuania atrilutea]|uniref:Uncharacterized protein n=1 Tax=Qipengyuania atrilutea TaxID=2744473 RepID=A0A850H4F1_9SPHN|nr:hypothetical protein [Actirhodobacter atriluteus]NVD45480.1 hypothetical protein [Actirhodobacter atriluteus]